MEKKKYWPLTLAAFGGGCLLMAAVYFCLGWWPFGTDTVLTGDLRGLYVNYITDMWARVKQGGFFYSFGKLAGGSTLGLFAYYMNSPFNLLFLLLPTRMVPQAAGLIFLLRTGVTAAAFCWYLQRHFAKADPLFAVLGQCYAFCAFCIVYNQNIIWMDVVWLLPLVLAALDDLMRLGRHWGFTVLVFLCILLNFYIAWPVCLFSILYFLCLWPSRGQGRFGRRFAAFAASGVLAAGLSFFFLLPVLLEVQESKGGLFDFTFSLTPRFNLLQLPYRLFFGNFFWNDVTNGLPNIYCGVVLVPLVLLYFCGNAPRREKLGFAGGAGGQLLGKRCRPNLARHEAAGVVPLPVQLFVQRGGHSAGRAGADGGAPAPPRLGAGRRADAGLAGGVSPGRRGGAVQQNETGCRGGAVCVFFDSGVAAD